MEYVAVNKGNGKLAYAISADRVIEVSFLERVEARSNGHDAISAFGGNEIRKWIAVGYDDNPLGGLLVSAAAGLGVISYSQAIFSGSVLLAKCMYQAASEKGAAIVAVNVNGTLRYSDGGSIKTAVFAEKEIRKGATSFGKFTGNSVREMTVVGESSSTSRFVAQAALSFGIVGYAFALFNAGVQVLGCELIQEQSGFLIARDKLTHEVLGGMDIRLTEAVMMKVETPADARKELPALKNPKTGEALEYAHFETVLVSGSGEKLTKLFFNGKEGDYQMVGMTTGDPSSFKSIIFFDFVGGISCRQVASTLSLDLVFFDPSGNRLGAMNIKTFQPVVRGPASAKDFQDEAQKAHDKLENDNQLNSKDISTPEEIAPVEDISKPLKEMAESYSRIAQDTGSELMATVAGMMNDMATEVANKTASYQQMALADAHALPEAEALPLVRNPASSVDPNAPTHFDCNKDAVRVDYTKGTLPEETQAFYFDKNNKIIGWTTGQSNDASSINFFISDGMLLQRGSGIVGGPLGALLVTDLKSGALIAGFDVTAHFAPQAMTWQTVTDKTQRTLTTLKDGKPVVAFTLNKATDVLVGATGAEGKILRIYLNKAEGTDRYSIVGATRGVDPATADLIFYRAGNYLFFSRNGFDSVGALNILDITTGKVLDQYLFQGLRNASENGLCKISAVKSTLTKDQLAAAGTTRTALKGADKGEVFDVRSITLRDGTVIKDDNKTEFGQLMSVLQQAGVAEGITFTKGDVTWFFGSTDLSTLGKSVLVGSGKANGGQFDVMGFGAKVPDGIYTVQNLENRALTSAEFQKAMKDQPALEGMGLTKGNLRSIASFLGPGDVVIDSLNPKDNAQFALILGALGTVGVSQGISFTDSYGFGVSFDKPDLSKLASAQMLTGFGSNAGTYLVLGGGRVIESVNKNGANSTRERFTNPDGSWSFGKELRTFHTGDIAKEGSSWGGQSTRLQILDVSIDNTGLLPTMVQELDGLYAMLTGLRSQFFSNGNGDFAISRFWDAKGTTVIGVQSSQQLPDGSGWRVRTGAYNEKNGLYVETLTPASRQSPSTRALENIFSQTLSLGAGTHIDPVTGAGVFYGKDGTSPVDPTSLFGKSMFASFQVIDSATNLMLFSATYGELEQGPGGAQGKGWTYIATSMNAATGLYAIASGKTKGDTASKEDIARVQAQAKTFAQAAEKRTAEVGGSYIDASGVITMRRQGAQSLEQGASNGVGVIFRDQNGVIVPFDKLPGIGTDVNFQILDSKTNLMLFAATFGKLDFGFGWSISVGSVNEKTGLYASGSIKVPEGKVSAAQVEKLQADVEHISEFAARKETGSRTSVFFKDSDGKETGFDGLAGAGKMRLDDLRDMSFQILDTRTGAMLLSAMYAQKVAPPGAASSGSWILTSTALDAKKGVAVVSSLTMNRDNVRAEDIAKVQTQGQEISKSSELVKTGGVVFKDASGNVVSPMDIINAGKDSAFQIVDLKTNIMVCSYGFGKLADGTSTWILTSKAVNGAAGVAIVGTLAVKTEKFAAEDVAKVQANTRAVAFGSMRREDAPKADGFGRVFLTDGSMNENGTLNEVGLSALVRDAKEMSFQFADTLTNAVLLTATYGKLNDGAPGVVPENGWTLTSTSYNEKTGLYTVGHLQVKGDTFGAEKIALVQTNTTTLSAAAVRTETGKVMFMISGQAVGFTELEGISKDMVFQILDPVANVLLFSAEYGQLSPARDGKEATFGWLLKGGSLNPETGLYTVSQTKVPGETVSKEDVAAAQRTDIRTASKNAAQTFPTDHWKDTATGRTYPVVQGHLRGEDGKPISDVEVLKGLLASLRADDHAAMKDQNISALAIDALLPIRSEWVSNEFVGAIFMIDSSRPVSHGDLSIRFTAKDGTPITSESVLRALGENLDLEHGGHNYCEIFGAIPGNISASVRGSMELLSGLGATRFQGGYLPTNLDWGSLAGVEFEATVTFYGESYWSTGKFNTVGSIVLEKVKSAAQAEFQAMDFKQATKFKGEMIKVVDQYNNKEHPDGVRPTVANIDCKWDFSETFKVNGIEKTVTGFLLQSEAFFNMKPLSGDAGLNALGKGPIAQFQNIISQIDGAETFRCHADGFVEGASFWVQKVYGRELYKSQAGVMVPGTQPERYFKTYEGGDAEYKVGIRLGSDYLKNPFDTKDGKSGYAILSSLMKQFDPDSKLLTEYRIGLGLTQFEVVDSKGVTASLEARSYEWGSVWTHIGYGSEATVTYKFLPDITKDGRISTIRSISYGKDGTDKGVEHRDSLSYHPAWAIGGFWEMVVTTKRETLLGDKWNHDENQDVTQYFREPGRFYGDYKDWNSETGFMRKDGSMAFADAVFIDQINSQRGAIALEKGHLNFWFQPNLFVSYGRPITGFAYEILHDARTYSHWIVTPSLELSGALGADLRTFHSGSSWTSTDLNTGVSTEVEIHFWEITRLYSPSTIIMAASLTPMVVATAYMWVEAMPAVLVTAGAYCTAAGFAATAVKWAWQTFGDLKETDLAYKTLTVIEVGGLVIGTICSGFSMRAATSKLAAAAKTTEAVAAGAKAVETGAAVVKATTPFWKIATGVNSFSQISKTAYTIVNISHFVQGTLTAGITIGLGMAAAGGIRMAFGGDSQLLIHGIAIAGFAFGARFMFAFGPSLVELNAVGKLGELNAAGMQGWKYFHLGSGMLNVAAFGAGIGMEMYGYASGKQFWQDLGQKFLIGSLVLLAGRGIALAIPVRGIVLARMLSADGLALDGIAGLGSMGRVVARVVQQSALLKVSTFEILLLDAGKSVITFHMLPVAMAALYTDQVFEFMLNKINPSWHFLDERSRSEGYLGHVRSVFQQQFLDPNAWAPSRILHDVILGQALHLFAPTFSAGLLGRFSATNGLFRAIIPDSGSAWVRTLFTKLLTKEGADYLGAAFAYADNLILFNTVIATGKSIALVAQANAGVAEPAPKAGSSVPGIADVGAILKDLASIPGFFAGMFGAHLSGNSDSFKAAFLSFGSSLEKASILLVPQAGGNLRPSFSDVWRSGELRDQNLVLNLSLENRTQFFEFVESGKQDEALTLLRTIRPTEVPTSNALGERELMLLGQFSLWKFLGTSDGLGSMVNIGAAECAALARGLEQTLAGLEPAKRAAFDAALKQAIETDAWSPSNGGKPPIENAFGILDVALPRILKSLNVSQRDALIEAVKTGRWDTAQDVLKESAKSTQQTIYGLRQVNKARLEFLMKDLEQNKRLNLENFNINKKEQKLGAEGLADIFLRGKLAPEDVTNLFKRMAEACQALLLENWIQPGVQTFLRASNEERASAYATFFSAEKKAETPTAPSETLATETKVEVTETAPKPAEARASIAQRIGGLLPPALRGLEGRLEANDVFMRSIAEALLTAIPRDEFAGFLNAFANSGRNIEQLGGIGRFTFLGEVTRRMNLQTVDDFKKLVTSIYDAFSKIEVTQNVAEKEGLAPQAAEPVAGIVVTISGKQAFLDLTADAADDFCRLVSGLDLKGTFSKILGDAAVSAPYEGTLLETLIAKMVDWNSNVRLAVFVRVMNGDDATPETTAAFNALFKKAEELQKDKRFMSPVEALSEVATQLAKQYLDNSPDAKKDALLAQAGVVDLVLKIMAFELAPQVRRFAADLNLEIKNGKAVIEITPEIQKSLKARVSHPELVEFLLKQKLADVNAWLERIEVQNWLTSLPPELQSAAIDRAAFGAFHFILTHGTKEFNALDFKADTGHLLTAIIAAHNAYMENQANDAYSNPSADLFAHLQNMDNDSHIRQGAVEEIENAFDAAKTTHPTLTYHEFFKVYLAKACAAQGGGGFESYARIFTFRDVGPRTGETAPSLRDFFSSLGGMKNHEKMLRTAVIISEKSVKLSMEQQKGLMGGLVGNLLNAAVGSGKTFLMVAYDYVFSANIHIAESKEGIERIVAEATATKSAAENRTNEEKLANNLRMRYINGEKLIERITRGATQEERDTAYAELIKILAGFTDTDGFRWVLAVSFTTLGHLMTHFRSTDLQHYREFSRVFQSSMRVMDEVHRVVDPTYFILGGDAMKAVELPQFFLYCAANELFVDDHNVGQNSIMLWERNGELFDRRGTKVTPADETQHLIVTESKDYFDRNKGDKAVIWVQTATYEMVNKSNQVAEFFSRGPGKTALKERYESIIERENQGIENEEDQIRPLSDLTLYTSELESILKYQSIRTENVEAGIINGIRRGAGDQYRPKGSDGKQQDSQIISDTVGLITISYKLNDAGLSHELAGLGIKDEVGADGSYMTGDSALSIRPIVGETNRYERLGLDIIRNSAKNIEKTNTLTASSMFDLFIMGGGASAAYGMSGTVAEVALQAKMIVGRNTEVIFGKGGFADAYVHELLAEKGGEDALPGEARKALSLKQWDTSGKSDQQQAAFIARELYDARGHGDAMRSVLAGILSDTVIKLVRLELLKLGLTEKDIMVIDGSAEGQNNVLKNVQKFNEGSTEKIVLAAQHALIGFNYQRDNMLYAAFTPQISSVMLMQNQGRVARTISMHSIFESMVREYAKGEVSARAFEKTVKEATGLDNDPRSLSEILNADASAILTALGRPQYSRELELVQAHLNGEPGWRSARQSELETILNSTYWADYRDATKRAWNVDAATTFTDYLAKAESSSNVDSEGFTTVLKDETAKKFADRDENGNLKAGGKSHDRFDAEIRIYLNTEFLESLLGGLDFKAIAAWRDFFQPRMDTAAGEAYKYGDSLKNSKFYNGPKDATAPKDIVGILDRLQENEGDWKKLSQAEQMLLSYAMNSARAADATARSLTGQLMDFALMFNPMRDAMMMANFVEGDQGIKERAILYEFNLELMRHYGTNYEMERGEDYANGPRSVQGLVGSKAKTAKEQLNAFLKGTGKDLSESVKQVLKDAVETAGHVQLRAGAEFATIRENQLRGDYDGQFFGNLGFKTDVKERADTMIAIALGFAMEFAPQLQGAEKPAGLDAGRQSSEVARPVAELAQATRDEAGRDRLGTLSGGPFKANVTKNSETGERILKIAGIEIALNAIRDANLKELLTNNALLNVTFKGGLAIFSVNYEDEMKSYLETQASWLKTLLGEDGFKNWKSYLTLYHELLGTGLTHEEIAELRAAIPREDTVQTLAKLAAQVEATGPQQALRREVIVKHLDVSGPVLNALASLEPGKFVKLATLAEQSQIDNSVFARAGFSAAETAQWGSVIDPLAFYQVLRKMPLAKYQQVSEGVFRGALKKALALSMLATGVDTRRAISDERRTNLKAVITQAAGILGQDPSAFYDALDCSKVAGASGQFSNPVSLVMSRVLALASELTPSSEQLRKSAQAVAAARRSGKAALANVEKQITDAIGTSLFVPKVNTLLVQLQFIKKLSEKNGLSMSQIMDLWRETDWKRTEALKTAEATANLWLAAKANPITFGDQSQFELKSLRDAELLVRLNLGITSRVKGFLTVLRENGIVFTHSDDLYNNLNGLSLISDMGPKNLALDVKNTLRRRFVKNGHIIQSLTGAPLVELKGQTVETLEFHGGEWIAKTDRGVAVFFGGDKVRVEAAPGVTASMEDNRVVMNGLVDEYGRPMEFQRHSMVSALSVEFIGDASGNQVIQISSGAENHEGGFADINLEKGVVQNVLLFDNVNQHTRDAGPVLYARLPSGKSFVPVQTADGRKIMLAGGATRMTPDGIKLDGKVFTLAELTNFDPAKSTMAQDKKELLENWLRISAYSTEFAASRALLPAYLKARKQSESLGAQFMAIMDAMISTRNAGIVPVDDISILDHILSKLTPGTDDALISIINEQKLAFAAELKTANSKARADFLAAMTPSERFQTMLRLMQTARLAGNDHFIQGVDFARAATELIRDRSFDKKAREMLLEHSSYELIHDFLKALQDIDVGDHELNSLRAQLSELLDPLSESKRTKDRVTDLQDIVPVMEKILKMLPGKVALAKKAGISTEKAAVYKSALAKTTDTFKDLQTYQDAYVLFIDVATKKKLQAKQIDAKGESTMVDFTVPIARELSALDLLNTARHLSGAQNLGEFLRDAAKRGDYGAMAEYFVFSMENNEHGSHRLQIEPARRSKFVELIEKHLKDGKIYYGVVNFDKFNTGEGTSRLGESMDIPAASNFPGMPGETEQRRQDRWMEQHGYTNLGVPVFNVAEDIVEELGEYYDFMKNNWVQSTGAEAVVSHEAKSARDAKGRPNWITSTGIVLVADYWWKQSPQHEYKHVTHPRPYLYSRNDSSGMIMMEEVFNFFGQVVEQLEDREHGHPYNWEGIDRKLESYARGHNFNPDIMKASFRSFVRLYQLHGPQAVRFGKYITNASDLVLLDALTPEQLQRMDAAKNSRELTAQVILEALKDELMPNGTTVAGKVTEESTKLIDELLKSEAAKPGDQQMTADELTRAKARLIERVLRENTGDGYQRLLNFLTANAPNAVVDNSLDALRAAAYKALNLDANYQPQPLIEDDDKGSVQSILSQLLDGKQVSVRDEAKALDQMREIINKLLAAEGLSSNQFKFEQVPGKGLFLTIPPKDPATAGKPIGFLGHIDVRTEVADDLAATIDSFGNVRAKDPSSALGADNRSGLAIILNTIRKLVAEGHTNEIRLIITTGEEVGLGILHAEQDRAFNKALRKILSGVERIYSADRQNQTEKTKDDYGRGSSVEEISVDAATGAVTYKEVTSMAEGTMPSRNVEHYIDAPVDRTGRYKGAIANVVGEKGVLIDGLTSGAQDESHKGEIAENSNGDFYHIRRFNTQTGQFEADKSSGNQIEVVTNIFTGYYAHLRGFESTNLNELNEMADVMMDLVTDLAPDALPEVKPEAMIEEEAEPSVAEEETVPADEKRSELHDLKPSDKVADPATAKVNAWKGLAVEAVGRLTPGQLDRIDPKLLIKAINTLPIKVFTVKQEPLLKGKSGFERELPGGAREIVLNSEVVERMTPSQLKDFVIHEAIHGVQAEVNRGILAESRRLDAEMQALSIMVEVMDESLLRESWTAMLAAARGDINTRDESLRSDLEHFAQLTATAMIPAGVGIEAMLNRINVERYVVAGAAKRLGDQPGRKPLDETALAKEMPEFKKLAEAGRTEHVSFEVLAQDIPAGSNLEKLLGILKSQGFMVFVVKEADILTDADLGRESWLVQYALGVGKTQFDNVMLQYASIPKPEGFYPIGSYLANEAIRRILDALMATRQTEVAA